MANNRELSQFASFVSVNDSNDTISIASTIASVNVSGAATVGGAFEAAGAVTATGALTASSTLAVTGASTLTGDVTVGSGSTTIELNTTTGIVSTAYGPIQIIASEDRVIGGASSNARAQNLIDELQKLSVSYIGAGVTVRLLLASGDYNLAGRTLEIGKNGPGRLEINGVKGTGTRPGATGNHFYNQAGVPNGKNPGAGSTSYTKRYDATSPAGAYPNPMVNGAGITTAAYDYNIGILKAYYGTQFYSNGTQDSTIETYGGSLIGEKDSTVIRVVSPNVGISSILLYNDKVIPNQYGSGNVPKFGIVARTGGAYLQLKDVAVHGTMYGMHANSNASIGISSCTATCCESFGMSTFLEGGIDIQGQSSFSWDKAGNKSASESVFGHTLCLNNGSSGIQVMRGGVARFGDKLTSNNNRDGIVFSFGGSGNYSAFQTNEDCGTSACNNTRDGLQLVECGSMEMDGDQVFFENNGNHGISIQESSNIDIGLVRSSYNGVDGMFITEGGHCEARNIGLTTNGRYGVNVNTMISLNLARSGTGRTTEIYDNNGSTAGKGAAPTTRQINFNSVGAVVNVTNVAIAYTGTPASNLAVNSVSNTGNLLINQNG